MMNRRQFIGKSALGVGSALIVSQIPVIAANGKGFGNLSGMPGLLGFQIWTIKDRLLKDFPGTLKMMSGLGYQSVEMCSPPGYGFKQLMGMKASEMKRIVEDAGLKLESTHYGMKELRENLDEKINFALESGQKQMILSSFGISESAKMSDWQKAADELNKIGERTKKAGIQMGFHNHHGEFGKIDGVLIYDELLNRFDPDLVKMQFQVAVISIGYKAADYFNKYPGRFISAHLADWSSTDKKQVPVGQGIVEWKTFFAAARKSGVKNYFVEMDPETFKPSADYLHKI